MREIPLTNSDEVAVVDDEDFEEVSGHRWLLREGKTSRAIESTTKINGKYWCLGRFLLRPPDGIDVDHKNRNPLDNRRENLRFATRSQNLANSRKPYDAESSIFKGVCWHKDRQKWMARIGFNKKEIYLGLFKSEVEAAIAYDKAAINYFGEFANVNL